MQEMEFVSKGDAFQCGMVPWEMCWRFCNSSVTQLGSGCLTEAGVEVKELIIVSERVLALNNRYVREESWAHSAISIYKIV